MESFAIIKIIRIREGWRVETVITSQKKGGAAVMHTEKCDTAPHVSGVTPNTDSPELHSVTFVLRTPSKLFPTHMPVATKEQVEKKEYALPFRNDAQDEAAMRVLIHSSRLPPIFTDPKNALSSTFKVAEQRLLNAKSKQNRIRPSSSASSRPHTPTMSNIDRSLTRLHTANPALGNSTSSLPFVGNSNSALLATNTADFFDIPGGGDSTAGPFSASSRVSSPQQHYSRILSFSAASETSHSPTSSRAVTAPVGATSRHSPLPRSPATPLELVSPAQRDVFHQISRARSEPHTFIDRMQVRLKYLRGKTFWFPGAAYMTKEGRAGYEESIQYLEQQQPIQTPALLSGGLCLAATDLAVDLGKRRLAGHQGSDASTVDVRVSRYGKWGGGLWEDICYGMTNAEDIVSELIVDDGIPTRFHRKNLFREGIGHIGVGMSSHVVYGSVCVIIYAKRFDEYPQQEQKQMHDWLQSTNFQSADICPGCCKEIKAAEGMYVCGKNWHPECCECVVCRQAIRQYYSYDSKPYCSMCHMNRFSSECSNCGTSLGVEQCKINGMVYCHSCYDAEWHPSEENSNALQEEAGTED